MTVGIIGAGISGLTLAYELQKRGIAYHLWEAAEHPGGYIQSQWKGRTTNEPLTSADAIHGPYLCELGPNSLVGDADMLLWLDELGLTRELVFSNPVSKARYIFRDGKYRQLPSGPPSLLLGSFFSWKTKLAIFRERNNRTISPPGETLAQFFRRRFSQEVVEYALGPFVAGIYAGDPEQLVVSETFPILLRYEKEYGSVLRGLIKNQTTAGRRQSFSFRNGLQTLPDTLAAALTGSSFNSPVERIDPTPDGWQVTTPDRLQTVDKLVLTVDTSRAAHLLATHNPSFAGALRAVTYPPMTAVHSVYKRVDVSHPLNGFGGLNPQSEGRFAAGHIWSSSLFKGRCPEDEVLFTTLVGGQTQAENARQSDEMLSTAVHQELVKSFGIKAEKPVFRSIYRWERAIPQYDANLAALRKPVEQAEAEQLFVSANWYGGVSLSDCIQKAQKLARRLSDR